MQCKIKWAALHLIKTGLVGQSPSCQSWQVVPGCERARSQQLSDFHKRPCLKRKQNPSKDLKLCWSEDEIHCWPESWLRKQSFPALWSILRWAEDLTMEKNCVGYAVKIPPSVDEEADAWGGSVKWWTSPQLVGGWDGSEHPSPDSDWGWCVRGRECQCRDAELIQTWLPGQPLVILEHKALWSML